MAETETNQHVQFGDGIHPVKSRSNTYAAALNESKVYAEKPTDADAEEAAANIRDRDLNSEKKQTYHGWLLMWLAYQSTGVIYGDIGTSPLYVYSSTFTSQPTYDDLVGALSLIIWALTIMVSVKYVLIVLRADDDGEGGTFALYTLLARYARIVKFDPSVSPGRKMARYKTDDLRPAAKNIRSFIEESMAARIFLKVVGVFGVALVMSDGVLTPAQSVLGAIQGIEVVHPDIGSSTIVGVSCAILVLLFAVQPFGISRIASAWAPIVVVWLLFNLCCGIYNLVMYDYTVLRAFSPYFAGQYFVRNGTEGWKSLGGILLAFTGVEALFADLGAFSKRAINLSWLCFAYPCLLLAYIGQAAYISQDATGEAYTNPFFHTVPPGSLYFSLVIAILAAIVASQAMITSSFQLLSQVMRLSYFPHIKMVHTSKHFHGQVYIPMANWLLMIGTIIVTAVYSNTTRLGNAYGVCVILVTFITTTMVSLVAIISWRLPWWVVLAGFLVFGCFDGLFLTSALTKVPTGAWFTLLLAIILSSIFILWRYGKEQQWLAEEKDHIDSTELLHTADDGLRLTEAFGNYPVSTVDGVGIFFDKAGEKVPLVFVQFARKFHARPEIMIFFHMRPLSQPTVPEAERYVLRRTSIAGCYRLTLRHGYMDHIVTPDLGRLIVERLVLFITRDHTSPAGSASSVQHSPQVAGELAAISKAQQAQMVYIMGKEQMKIKRGANIARRLLLSAFLWIRENSRTKMADLDIPTDNLVELGFVKEI